MSIFLRESFLHEEVKYTKIVQLGICPLLLRKFILQIYSRFWLPQSWSFLDI